MQKQFLKYVATALLMAASLCASAQEKTNLATEPAVRELLTHMGQKELMLQVMRQMAASSAQTMPNVPAEFWNKLIVKAESSDMLAIVVPIYQKHFSASDLAALLAFYRSDVGKKMIQLQPTLLNEAMQAGGKWGEELARQVVLEFLHDEAKKKKEAPKT